MKKLVLLLASGALALLLASGAAWAATVTDITERGVGTTRQTTPDGCQFGGTCTDRVSGSIVGTPIDNPRTTKTEAGPAGIMGTVSSDFSKAEEGPGGPGTYSVATRGDIRLSDADGGRLLLAIKGKTTGPNSGPDASFEGTFTVTRGTGQFRNVEGGRGDVEFEVTDAGETSTFRAFLDGSLRRAEEERPDDSGGEGDGKRNKDQQNKGRPHRGGVFAGVGPGGAWAIVGGVRAIAHR